MVERITSINNETVKLVSKLQQKKYRDFENKFLIEGEKAVNEAILNGIEIEKIFVLEKSESEISFANSVEVNEKVMSKISDTKSPPNVIAVAQKRNYDLVDFKNFSKIILLENIKDAGNLGTILRSAIAFDFNGVILAGNCVDLYSSKVVRSAVGNFLKIPVIEEKNIENIKKVLNSHKFYSTLMPTTNAKNIRISKLQMPLVLMMGSEADGLTQKAIELADEAYTIPMNKNVESLNLAVSASIFLYEINNNAK